MAKADAVVIDFSPIELNGRLALKLLHRTNELLHHSAESAEKSSGRESRAAKGHPHRTDPDDLL